jgi:hypothetical protein
MQPIDRRGFLVGSLATAAWLALPEDVRGGPFAPGVETILKPTITGEERTRQTDLWALELHFKPLRMIANVEVPEPRTGKTTAESFLYIAYRVVNRNPDSRSQASSTKADDRPIFVPQLTLAGFRGNKLLSFDDRIVPAAHAAILRRERHPYKNSVELVRPIPAPATDEDLDPASLDGIAIFRDVDPDLVRLSIFFTGFSNGYVVAADDKGKEIVQRKTIEMKLWRQGERFEQYEDEFREDEPARWIYR